MPAWSARLARTAPYPRRRVRHYRPIVDRCLRCPSARYTLDRSDGAVDDLAGAVRDACAAEIATEPSTPRWLA